MVVHETYRDKDGNWHDPQEVRLEGHDDSRKAYLISSGEELIIGSIEKMSKSKKNTIGPEEITQSFGADTARWFMLSDSPPDRDVEWTDSGAEGAHRFVQRVWRLVSAWSSTVGGNLVEWPDVKNDLAIRKTSHKVLKNVGEDIEKLAFNRAIARIHEFVNSLPAAPDNQVTPETASAMREALSILLQIIAPFMPRLAEECWQHLGFENLVAECQWPEHDNDLAADDILLLPVQINGKKRAEVEVNAEASAGEIEAATMQLDVVRKFLEGQEPRKIIVVPKRIVNVVI